eukprot:TRINITY_DN36211_c0_g1_i1.p1 TRINITY_DN36211_c0_g1~~TRINITY_DN36211_c0_g1_i1.p1  ORF type:complete len:362 (-),score=85.52 TRINITY_DN36211_c0_g1_i1:277-1362(-)
MADMRLVCGPREGDEAISGPVQWTLVNAGSAPWPEGSSLRLICGPAICPPVVMVPPALPGQTVEIAFEAPEAATHTQLCYVLVDEKGVSFGEWLHVAFAPPSKPLPLARVIVAPGEAERGAVLCASQGDVVRAEFVVVNAGQVPWPEDTTLALIYNSYLGFRNVPCHVEVPKGVQPLQTVQVSLAMQLAERSGPLTAMWALQSPSVPDFGEVLVVNLQVDDFPALLVEEDAESMRSLSWVLAGADDEVASHVDSLDGCDEWADSAVHAECPEPSAATAAGPEMETHADGESEKDFVDCEDCPAGDAPEVETDSDAEAWLMPSACVETAVESEGDAPSTAADESQAEAPPHIDCGVCCILDS